MWEPQVALLSRRWRCIAPDLPGHGDRRGEPFTTAGAIAAIEDALGEAGEGAHLVGCSLGGMFALHAAAATQLTLGSVIAAGCSTQPRPSTARLYGRLIGAVDRAGGEAAVRRVMGAEGAAHFLRKGRADLATVATAVEAVAKFSLLRDTAAIEAPVAFLNGRFDQFRGQERRFARAARQGRLVVLGYGTHMVNLTHPAAYTQTLERLLLDAERMLLAQ